MSKLSRRSLVVFSMAALLVDGDLARSQCSDLESFRFTASDGASGDAYGKDVCLLGDLAVIGAPSVKGPRGFSNGAIYVYRDQGGAWVEEDKILWPLVGAGLGSSLATNGLYILAWVSRTDEVYVYRWGPSGWVESQVLLPSGMGATDIYSTVLQMEGDWAFVGDPGDDDVATDAGAVYVLRRQSLTWVEHSKLHPSIGQDLERFGESFAVDQDVLAIGSTSDQGLSTGGGAVYVYRKQPGGWTEEDILRPSQTADLVRFASVVDVDGNRIAAKVIRTSQEGVVVFQSTGTTWIEEQEVVVPAKIGDVVLEGDTLVAGQPVFPTSALHVFRLRNGQWVKQQELSNSAPTQQFWGRTLALDDGRLLAGDSSGNGAAYLYQVADLALDIVPTTVNPMDSIQLSSCGGLPLGGMILVSIEENGRPTFTKVGPPGRYDAAGQFTRSYVVPPGLSGLVVTFQAFGFTNPGVLVRSNTRTVTFQ